MLIEEIKQLWEQDSVIDKDNLENEALLVDALHWKYSNILYDIAIEKSKITKELNKLNVDKFNYYAGIGTNVSPVKILKTLAPNYVKGDSDVLYVELSLEEVTARYNYVDSIIWAISRRNYSIGNHISVLKLQKGI